ncbi:unnamed protein product [Adineta steineri]|uniref:Uncharacterized protein n=1 Tax=Adineta steineri TaxID=433720 RepID=A0A819D170_9BILA|nr:unnamed protein product [Adineta steineri]CAF3826969.1 unnamed protein product [Adineta steineri]
MDSSNRLFNVQITYGKQTLTIQNFNKQTNFEQIHKYICNSFDLNSPKSYQIVYYDPETLSFVDLKDPLHQGFSLSNNIHFFVVNNSSIHSDISSHNASDIQIDQAILHINNENSSSNENYSFNIDVSVDSIKADDDTLQSDTEYSHTINEDLVSNRLFFSLDVKPTQRDMYKSDQFNSSSEKANGRISRVQGIKDESAKMRQVLPKLRIPSMYRQLNVKLLVFVVSEDLQNGMHIWYKHCHKGFLPENFTKDTETINPIEFDLSKCNLTNEGDFILSVQMITKWNKSSREVKEFYRLEDNKTKLIHSAPHDTHSPRLLCVIQRNGIIEWNTLCLSDFIKSPKPAKHAYSNINSDQTHSSPHKRLKTGN